MSNRRDAVKALAAIPFAFSFDLSVGQRARVSQAMLQARAAPEPYSPKFFNANEWKTVRMLVDYIIPADERSGSATDAKVPEYMDFLMADKDASDSSRIAMRGGLGWLNFESIERFGKTFVNATDSERRQILDDIAWPKKARPEMSHGVAFFNRFRDLTASGFFSSEMGWKDVRYVGNVFNPNYAGCPPAALQKLGVTGEEMKTRVAVEYERR